MIRPVVASLLLAFIFTGAGGCKSAEDEATRRRAAELAAQVEEQAREAAKIAHETAHNVTDQAGDLAGQAGQLVGVARTVKAELDKVYKTDSSYDLTVDAVDAPSDHAAQLAAMPNVTIGDVVVGYHEDNQRSLRGVAYARHFRATWNRDGKAIGVSYFSQEEIDAVAFIALARKLVPIVNAAL